jgi:predicted nucleic acid-binding Zn ribbon protein
MKRKPLKAPLAIGEVLENVLQRKGIAKKMAQYTVFEEWRNIVGETIARCAVPQKVQGSTLVVRAKNAAWANELAFMKPQILKKIRESSPDSLIEDIRFISR